ncbi:MULTISPECIES: hypothetical protein [unclassified Minwuia]|jgi:hypothetical protein|uniref:hypothetical protein n=1 Tax=unclassified Minwuia TaxID=2618799 RepID=UPI0024795BCC|nr:MULTISPECIES: hypothetical protein [unclassified Minwuia]
MTELDPAIRAQIDAIDIIPGRPLVISDADEVLFAFMEGLERYLNSVDLTFDWSSFGITGNVRDADGRALEGKEVRTHLGTFFANHTAELTPVPGAAEALAHLSERAQIVVLSNIPANGAEGRRQALRRHGMDFPLVANEGLKGPAVRLLQQRAGAEAIFIDDIPHNHTSVARSAVDVHRLHFVADPRLAPMLPMAEDAHHRADTWPEATPFIEARLFGD